MLDQETALRIAGEMAVAYAAYNLSDEKIIRWAGDLRPLNEGDARRVVDYVTKRTDSPPSRKQLLDTISEIRKKTVSPPMDSSLCEFEDGLKCRNCGEVHGHALPKAQILHGTHHLRRHLGGEPDELVHAKYPEGCECGFQPPVGEDGQAALAELAEGLIS